MDKLWLYLALAGLVLTVAALAGACIRRTGREQRLAQEIERFLRDGTSLSYSVCDDRFARLHNDVCDLMSQCAAECDNRRRMLQESGDFIADVSHQLKTPLAGLRLWCELTDDSNGRENAAKELELVERMEHLVQGLLRLAKARDEGVPFRFAPCSLSALVSGCLDELRPLFPQKQVALAGDATLSCDSSWLGEAVSNVLKNAFEHTAANGVVAVQIAQEASTVTVTVRDNGGGVPEAELPRLFHRFVTSGNATPNSTGIGLAISRAIVERHHGSITAENTADGLLVTLCFPLIDGIEKLSYDNVS